jgi:PAS domain S-box-containing protein
MSKNTSTNGKNSKSHQERSMEFLLTSYDALFDQASDAIVLWDQDMKITGVNRKAEELSGLSRKHLIGQSVLSVLEEESVKTAVENFRKMLENGQATPPHLLKIKCAGGTRSGEHTSAPIKVGDKIVAFQTVIRDATERLESEEALRASEEKLRAIFESVVDAIAVTDLEGNITQVNNATLVIYGCSKREEMVGRNGLEFLSKKDHKKARDNIEKMLTEGPISGIEYTALKIDGTEYSIEISAAVIRDKTGKPEGFVSVAKDITERKAIERKLKESEERFRTIFDNATDGILLADSETKKFHTANKAMCEMLGYNSKEIEKLGVQDVHPKKDLRYVQKQFDSQIRKEKTLAENIPVLRKDGSVFYADVNSSPVALGGKTYLMGIFRDITARKHMEEQFLRSERLESLGMFAAGLAHDFKEYISRIFGHASFLRNSTDQKSPNYRRISDLLEAAQEASELVDRLKAFSGKSTFHPTVMSVDAPINETIRILRRHIRPNITIDAKLEARPGIVNADYWQLQKAILNILTNACDAMPTGGTLKVQTLYDKVDSKLVRAYPWITPGRHVVISIKDTGLGVDRKTLDKLFDPFFTTKGKGKGAGLGLSIAYGIVKDHKGTIQVRSKTGKGSTFDIYLPAVKS